MRPVMMRMLLLFLLAASMVCASTGPNLDHFAGIVRQNLGDISQWPTMATNYETFEDLIRHGRGTPLILEALQLEIKHATNGDRPIDAYHLGWNWHPAFVTCRDKYRQLEQRAVQTLRSATVPNVEQLMPLLGTFQCIDVRSKSDQALEIIEALIDALKGDPNVDNLGATIIQIESTIDHYVPPGTQDPPLMYYMARSKLQSLKGDHLAAVRELIEGVQRHVAELDIIDALINQVADPGDHIYQKVVAGQKAKFTTIPLLKCAWDRLPNYSDWNVALGHLDDLVAGCGYTPTISLAIKEAIRIFLLAGSLRFKEAAQVISSFKSPSKDEKENKQASAILLLAEEYRTKLQEPLLAKIKNSRGKDLKEIKWAAQELLRKASSLVDQQSTSQEAKRLRLEREAKARTEADAKLRETEALREQKDEANMAASFAIFEKTKGRDETLGDAAYKRFIQLIVTDYDQAIASKDSRQLSEEQFNKKIYEIIWEASVHFHLAQMNLRQEDAFGMRSDIDVRLGSNNINNRLGLDVRVLGFGWRKEYSVHFDTFIKRKESILQKLADGQVMRPEEIKFGLKSPTLIDIRPECEIEKEVAEVMAQSWQWTAALNHLKSKCANVSIDDHSRLIGAAAMGVKVFYTEKRATLAREIVEYGQSQKDVNSPLMKAAIASLIYHLDLKISGKETMVFEDFDEAKKHFPRLSTSQALAAATTEGLLDVFEKATLHDRPYFLPIIRAVYQTQAKDGYRIFNMRAVLLYKYYKSLGDMWQARYWLQQATFSRTERINAHIMQYHQDMDREAFIAFKELFKEKSGTNKMEIVTKTIEGEIGESSNKAEAVKAISKEREDEAGKSAKEHNAEKVVTVQKGTDKREKTKTEGSIKPIVVQERLDREEKAKAGSNVKTNAVLGKSDKREKTKIERSLKPSSVYEGLNKVKTKEAEGVNTNRTIKVPPKEARKPIGTNKKDEEVETKAVTLSPDKTAQIKERKDKVPDAIQPDKRDEPVKTVSKKPVNSSKKAPASTKGKAQKSRSASSTSTHVANEKSSTPRTGSSSRKERGSKAKDEEKSPKRVREPREEEKVDEPLKEKLSTFMKRLKRLPSPKLEISEVSKSRRRRKALRSGDPEYLTRELSAKIIDFLYAI